MFNTNSLISYFEEGFTPYLRDYSRDSHSTYIIGACTGSIAASAIASASSLTTLLPLAVEAVRIAFRTGLYIGDVAERLDGPQYAFRSWSTIIATSDKKTAENVVERYNQAHVNIVSLLNYGPLLTSPGVCALK